MTKNEHYRALLQNCVRIPCRYCNDIWFATAENMSYIKLKLEACLSWRSRPIAKSANKTNYMALSQTEPTRLARKHSADLEQVSFPLYPPSDLHKRRWLDRCALSGDQ